MGSAATAKFILLMVMALTNSTILLIMRYTLASTSSDDMYSVNHVIFMAEIGKLILSCICEFIATKGHLIQSLRENMSSKPCDALKPIIPSVLYLIQNNLSFIALSCISPPLFQVTYQGKLLSTAIISILLLDRKYTKQQWICLLVLTIGVALVVAEGSNDEIESVAIKDGCFFLGIAAIVTAFSVGSVAGVYFEMVLKSPSLPSGRMGGSSAQPTSMWIRNMQLAFFSILSIFLQQYYAINHVSKPLHGFTWWVWLLVALQAWQSIVITAVLKYTDNVFKGITSCFSVCFCTALSWHLFGTSLGAGFFIGTGLVFVSAYIFSNPIKKAMLKGILFKNYKGPFLHFFLVFLSLWKAYGILTSISKIEKQSALVPGPCDCNLKFATLKEKSTEGEKEYLATYPDVAEAVSAGYFDSGFHHFKTHGAKENREYLWDADKFTLQQHCLSSCSSKNSQWFQSLLPNASLVTLGLPPTNLNESYFYSIPRHGGSCPGIFDLCTASYARPDDQVSQRSQRGNCATLVDVLNWLTQTMNSYEERMILIAGGLIKLLRDKTLFWEDGTPIDQDLDFLVSYETFDFVWRLEPLLWQKFGWTMRSFLNCDGYTVFAQLIAVCGHILSNECLKSQQPVPGIEFYATHYMQSGALGILWEQEFIPSYLIFPLRHYILPLPESDSAIDFQIPGHAEILLTCSYGNWSLYSNKSLGGKSAHACLLDASQQLGYYNEAMKVTDAYSPYYRERE